MNATRRRRLLLGLTGAAALAAVLAVLAYLRLRESLPALDGTLRLPGLGATVLVERDGLGVPTLTGASRRDLARATGFLHAQDRFFQMDLLRRRAAGELAALVGAGALPLDLVNRRHGFRALAGAVLGRMGPEDRATVDAYTAGVNAGLSALGAVPFEYTLLRTRPQPWRSEDSVLVEYAMFLELQDGQGRYERDLGVVRDELGQEALAFFAPIATEGDAALDGSKGPAAPVPGPDVMDLRGNAASGEGQQARLRSLPTPAPVPEWAGSNALAVGGSHTADGAALLADDMHLHLGVPAPWYRLSLVFGGRRITGISLPGVPYVVAGSNGRVAWGFTNACADCADRVLVEPTASPDLYRVPGRIEAEAVQVRHEVIEVRGGSPVPADYRWTRWGPLVGRQRDERLVAYHWTAYDPAAVDLTLGRLEDAGSARQAVDIAHRAGCPALNLVAADASGSIAWTIAGRLPRRVGFSGRLPTNWTFGDRSWNGLVRPEDMPSIIDPPGGRLWSGNSRAVGGAALDVIGDGGYAAPARARQLKGDLDALVGRGGPVGPADLLAIELDDRAVLLSDWRQILINTLDDRAVEAKAGRRALRAAVVEGDLRADTDSAAYRIVKLFRLAVADRVFTPIFTTCADAEPDFDWHHFNFEAPLRTLLRARPAHLLDPAFARWDDLLLAAADSVGEQLHREGLPPERATWGAANLASIRHPLLAFLPRWLTLGVDMPADPLPGDTDMPRVQGPAFGASERFAVAPGHEAQGVFEMPGGQSGHPLSPYFRAGHAGWVRGEPGPFLPGPAEHRLSLSP